ncbi:MAG: glycosyltransferase [Bacteroidia bacterium]|nr:glycosyltransferase [Bacteroidia bacterium]
MKVAYLLGSLSRGGTETLLLDLFNNGDKANFDFVGVHRKDGPYKDDFYNSGKPFYKISPKFPFDPLYLWRLRQFIKSNNVSIVHSQQCIDTLYAGIATIGLSTKVVQTFHGYDYGASKYARFILKLSLKLAVKNIFVSKYERDYYVSKYKIDNTKTAVVYNGINFEKLDFDYPDPNLPNYDNDSLKLCMVGNFVSVRNHYTICKFLHLLKETSVKFDFYFVGRKNEAESILYDKCVEYCNKYNLNDYVHFLGARADVPAILKRMNAFVYSTDHDTFGIAAVEAMAFGIPVFVNDYEVMKEITHNGEWATLYRTKDAKDLYIKFMSSVKNNKLQSNDIIASKVRDRFSIKQHIDNLYSVYQKN